MKVIGLLVVFLAIILFELPGMLRQKMWRETAVFSGLMVIGMILSFAAALNIHLPVPTKYIDMIFGPVSRVVLSFFE